MKKIRFTGLADTEFQEKIRQYHQEFLTKMDSWLVKPSFRRSVTVHVCDRMKSNAGRAYYLKLLMKLNYWMLYKNDVELRDTYGHELAHLITFTMYSRRGYIPKGHGDEWKHVMRALGLVPKRCHDLSRYEMKKMKTEYKEERDGRKNQTQQEDVLSAAASPGRP